MSLQKTIRTFCLLSALPKYTGQVDLFPWRGKTKCVCKGLLASIRYSCKATCSRSAGVPSGGFHRCTSKHVLKHHFFIRGKILWIWWSIKAGNDGVTRLLFHWVALFSFLYRLNHVEPCCLFLLLSFLSFFGRGFGARGRMSSIFELTMISIIGASLHILNDWIMHTLVYTPIRSLGKEACLGKTMKRNRWCHRLIISHDDSAKWLLVLCHPDEQ